MERTIKGKGTQPVNNGDKCWVTVSMTVNLGNYESLKVESGYSQTINPREEALELLERMQEEIEPIVLDYAKNLKKRYKAKE